MILTIFLKELKDTLRDRRTIIMMVVIPILIFPLILNVFIGISSSFEKDAANKTITIGVIGEKNGFISNTLSKIPDRKHIISNSQNVISMISSAQIC